MRYDQVHYEKVVFKRVIESAPTVDAVPVTFETFRLVCKFFAIGYDEDRGTELTCRRKDMIPEGDSWGECSPDKCPFLNANKDSVK
jgi:hypothetical protein